MSECEVSGTLVWDACDLEDHEDRYHANEECAFGEDDF